MLSPAPSEVSGSVCLADPVLWCYGSAERLNFWFY